MTEWQTRWAQSACFNFNADGILDYERWVALPDGKTTARQDADLLKRQIYLYEPDMILTGGWGLVSNILRDEIFADDAEWSKLNKETALWYYKSRLVCTDKETLVVSMPHPNRAAKN